MPVLLFKMKYELLREEARHLSYALIDELKLVELIKKKLKNYLKNVI